VSGTGSPTAVAGAAGARVAIVAASWHEEIMTALIDSAVRTTQQAGATASVFRVPGSFELAPAAQAAAAAGFDAVVALGVVVRGGTPHFAYVCDAATAGLNRVTPSSRRAIGPGCRAPQRTRGRKPLRRRC
jgi:6,7-dimethyl-8-ribityllumazine synthase